ncbi:helix-turn-helix domain-containing protein [Vibrio scophthalmi]|uniref:helix-turn-helix domain-containing protein n=1 Tax=Vibrio scophthalmi TaxID=45658 RepID=UPI00349F85A0
MQQLAHCDQRILDVALEYGFESQEAFSRAFRQYTCTQPSQLRGREIWADRMSFPRLNIKHLRLLSSVLILPLTIVSQKPTRWGCYTLSSAKLSQFRYRFRRAVRGITEKEL